MAQKSSRKRRKERRAAAAPAAGPAEEIAPVEHPGAGEPEELAPVERPAAGEPATSARGYARGRAKDEEARRTLSPLRPGERPTAVTVGAVVAALFALANVIALVLGWNGGTDADEAQRLAGSGLVTVVLAVVAYGMWKARYWAVLGLQTLLALAIIAGSLALITAQSLWAAVLLVLIVGGCGTLFWFMVKAMARIQMPERPGSTPRR